MTSVTVALFPPRKRRITSRSSEKVSFFRSPSKSTENFDDPEDLLDPTDCPDCQVGRS
eukprot:CAMPEP_0180621268 /NCGR_PEP_ID=MMETSP1037_2-20121125/35049_1 /TAXON_ID=632150 /ORGANISM="Azadinium spinosum, Strain 3D9" /LENGTH=57 /DNA_ID=CAMNT_0022641415 /DNA_START=112 /DNA_END=281 /DNA_ORIENTATION=+